MKENDKIKVVVSRSKLLMDVPNLVGTELPKAINKLRNLHYQGKAISILTGIISYIPSEKVSGNIILAQSPKAKEKMTPDMKINLLVSTGKVAGTQKMPQVVGQSIDLCYDLLAAKGLTVIQQAVVTGVKKLSGRVISQSIRTNAFFKKGQTVVLKVYYYKLKDHPYTAYEKVDYVIPRDQKAGLYEAYIEDHRSKRIRFSRKMRPGQNVFFIFNRSGNAKVTIMNNKKNIWIKEISVE